jgi:protein involved in polysaccharide export with SLBB domain
MTLLAALARAGGTRRRPAVRRSSCARAASRPTAKRAEAESHPHRPRRSTGRNTALNITLQDGDTLNVPKAQSVFVSGQVKNARRVRRRTGTTVLQVLSLAGGLTDRGADSRMRIQRMVKASEGNEGEAHRHGTAGDTIIVPQKFF